MSQSDSILIDPLLFLTSVFVPSIVTWNRLEGRPRKEDFDRSLKAEVRDPLWMLCRQWQFGEYRGEDAGSAVKAKVQVETARLNRYAAAGEPAYPYDDGMPLEVRVEREAVPPTLALRVQVGGHFRKLAAVHWAAVQNHYLGQFPIEAPAGDSEAEVRLQSDGKVHAFHAAVSGRVVDGVKLLAAIADGSHQAFIAGLGLSGAVTDDLTIAASNLAAWFGRLYSTPESGEGMPWRPSRLEYRFACAAPSDQAGVGQTVVKAEEYPGGHLDWHAFDLDLRNQAALPDAPGVVIATDRFVRHDPISFLPAPIEYGGMPNVRWWQFEDRKTDFGDIRASTTDLALLMLAEFGLIYGNDWSLVPYDLTVGSLARVLGVVVTDVFGVRTFVRRAGTRDDEGWQHWNLYNLTNLEGGNNVLPYMFLPPAIGRSEEGGPIDKVTLFRDEMANLVFGMEEIIPGERGNGTSGAEAAAALDLYLREKAEAAGLGPEVTEETEALIRYVAGTTVPENWIPFLATHSPGSDSQTRLQRGRMPRAVPLSPLWTISETVAPRGGILAHGLEANEPYLIHEEEVPRSGVQITRAFQRTRWYDGKVFTWLGRHKRTGRGEGLSGLRFDQIGPRQSTPDGPTTPDDPGTPDG